MKNKRFQRVGRGYQRSRERAATQALLDDYQDNEWQLHDVGSGDETGDAEGGLAALMGSVAEPPTTMAAALALLESAVEAATAEMPTEVASDDAADRMPGTARVHLEAEERRAIAHKASVAGEPPVAAGAGSPGQPVGFVRRLWRRLRTACG